MKAMSARVLLLVTMAAMGFAATAEAQTYWADPGADNWFDAANWTAGVPTSSKDAYIDNGGTAQITASGALSRDLWVGYTADTGAGAVEQTGGTHTVNSSLLLGYGSGSSGAYALSAGDLLVKSHMFLAYFGTATFTQTGGTHTINSYLFLGADSGSSGTYTLSDGSLDVGSSATIGRYGGTGTFTQTGGTHTVKSGSLSLDSKGAYALSGGTLSAPNVTGSGTFTQTGGTATLGRISVSGMYSLSGGTANVTGNIDGSGTFAWDGGVLNLGGTLTSNLRVGNAPGSDATLVLDGTLNPKLSPSNLYVGYSGRGTVSQSAGPWTVNSSLYLGYESGSSSTYTLSDGSLGVGASAYIGRYGTGTFTQTGGTHTVNSSLFLGYYSGSSGTYTLSDGSLGVGSYAYVGYSSTGTATFTHTGGTHTVGQNLSIGSMGVYHLQGGTLSVTGSVTGSGILDVSGGLFQVGGTIANLAFGYESGSDVTYALPGAVNLSVSNLTVGYSGSAQVTHSQGDHTVSTLYVGRKSGSAGTYALSGGSLSGSTRYVGSFGTGTFNQTGGQNEIGGLSLGQWPNGVGTYTLSKGTLTTGETILGVYGTGSLVQTDGIHKTSSLTLGISSGEGLGVDALRFWSQAGFFVSFAPGPNCLVIPGAGWTVYSFEDGGGGGFGDAIIRVYDGSPLVIEGLGGGAGYKNKLYLLDEVIIENTGVSGWTYVLPAISDIGEGSYRLDGGELVADQVQIGKSGTGQFTQTGGTHTVNSSLYLGYNNGSSGTYTLSDGSLTVGSAYVGSSGTGTFNQTGGEHTASSLDVGRDGLYDLSGGSLSAARLFVSEGGRFEATGGTFDATDSLSVAGTLVVTGCTQAIQVKVTVSQTGAVEVNSGVLSAPTVDVAGRVSLAGGTLAASAISFSGIAGSRIEGFGTVAGRVTGDIFSEIEASGGALSLGDANSWAGFSTAGGLKVGSEKVTLYSRAFVTLGNLTELAGGTLAAPNGIALGPGTNLVGWGTVDTKVAAGFGSTIAATDDLTLGKSNAYDGFFSDGSLLTGAHAVTIQDRNMAVLGSLTQLGDGSDGGTLTAGNANPADTYAHFLLEQGKNMVGRGYVNGHFKNHGDVIGDGVAMIERLIFNRPWIVSGKGTFTNTMILGTFAPGDSPTITSGTNQGFGGTVQIELGGTAPGSGNDNHDQINDSATIWLFGSPTLEILPWNNFIPQLGDEFVILTWQTGLDGTFGTVDIDSLFTDHGVSFALQYNNVSGAGNLTLEATPEPATLALLALGGLGLAMVRRRRAGRSPSPPPSSQNSGTTAGRLRPEGFL